MFLYDQVTVGTSPVEIVAADTEHITEVIITIPSLFEDSIYFGDSDVTSSSGLAFTGPGSGVAWNLSFTSHLHPGQAIYAISSSVGGISVSYLATA